MWNQWILALIQKCKHRPKALSVKLCSILSVFLFLYIITTLSHSSTLIESISSQPRLHDTLNSFSQTCIYVYILNNDIFLLLVYNRDFMRNMTEAAPPASKQRNNSGSFDLLIKTRSCLPTGRESCCDSDICAAWVFLCMCIWGVIFNINHARGGTGFVFLSALFIRN